MYKPLADSTLMRMNKRELIQLLRIAEHNERVNEKTLETQASNFEELLLDERNKVIDNFVKVIISRLTDAIYPKDVVSMTNLINEIVEQLKVKEK